MAKLITMTLIPVFLVITTKSIYSEKKCVQTVCGRRTRAMQCQDGTLLIWNVTHVTTGRTNTLAYQNIRRMCMGKSRCDTTNLCQRSRDSLRVMYSCVNDTLSNEKCSNSQQIVSNTYGVLRNNGYPSTDNNNCNIEIQVPDHSYVRITIHDIEWSASSPFCVGGLHLTTRQTCKGLRFPNEMICRIENNSSVITACGDVFISVRQSMYAFRYFLTYEVASINGSPQLSELGDMFTVCPDGQVAKESNMKEHPVPHILPTDSLIEVAAPRNNTTVVTVSHYGPTSSVDYTERTVFYVALAVAALSLSGLIAVTIICIRRQRLLKSGGTNVDLATLLGARSLSNAMRPLPPVGGGRSCHGNDHPRLEDGYSVVADEIPYSQGSDDLRSPAYAEVEDNISGPRTIFRFGLNGTNRLSMPRKSIENVYSELNDSKDKNVYNEIQDDESSTAYHNSEFSHNDNKQLIKDSRPKVGSTDKTANDHSALYDGPYAYIDVKERRHSSSWSQKSDSDGSLALMESDIYEPFQSAHV